MDLGNSANIQTMGAVGSKKEIAPDSRNVGLRMERGSVNQESSQAIYDGLGGFKGEYFRTDRG